MKKPDDVVEIAQLGNSVLRQQAEKVEDIWSDKIQGIIKNMLNILSESEGVGLAAPQIFESVSIIVIASRPSERYPSAPEMKPVVMINPKFEILSEETKKDWEGCLSIPGIRALVPRYMKLKITYVDCHGVLQEMIVEDFVARIFQHEIDHLHGFVYLDRVENNEDIISEVEFQKLMKL